jgi:hypothetical protein
MLNKCPFSALAMSIQKKARRKGTSRGEGEREENRVHEAKGSCSRC